MNRLKEIRINKGLKINEACKLIGISACYLSQLETGYRQISSSMLKKICEGYKVKPNEVLDYDEMIEIDENATSFSQQDIKMLRAIKSLPTEDYDLLMEFVNYLIYRHQQRIEAYYDKKRQQN